MVASNDTFGEAKVHLAAALTTLNSGHIVQDGLTVEDPNDIERAQVSNILYQFFFLTSKMNKNCL